MLTKISEIVKSFGQKICNRSSDMPCGISPPSSTVISRLDLDNLPDIRAGQPPNWEFIPNQHAGNSEQYAPELWRAEAITITPNRVEIRRVNNGSMRYLKWQNDRCTGMELDRDAREFITGPFSGCTFFMCADENEVPIILHSNTNSSKIIQMLTSDEN
jgi:hypothetical protein